MDTWDEQRIYITTLATKIAIKQKKVTVGSRHNTTFSYILKLEDGTSRRVCRSLFAFSLSERTITNWLIEDRDLEEQEPAPAPEKQSGPKHGSHAKLEEEVTAFLKDCVTQVTMVTTTKLPVSQ